MNGTRMLEIAKELKKLYSDRAGAELYAYSVGKEQTARQLALIPADGWPGKNAEQRDQARDIAYAADATLRRILTDLDSNRVKAANIQAAIEALEAERRAIEWNIREVLAVALAGKRDNHAPVEEAGFDEAMTETAVEYAVVPLEGQRLTDEPAPDGYSATDDDLPF